MVGCLIFFSPIKKNLFTYWKLGFNPIFCLLNCHNLNFSFQKSEKVLINLVTPCATPQPSIWNCVLCCRYCQKDTYNVNIFQRNIVHSVWRIFVFIFVFANISLNIHIRICICFFLSPQIYSYSYLPFFINPNIFVFVFVLDMDTEYISINLSLHKFNQIP